ncbi:hypothetical protein F383_30896 [Gossypium arboreum]|uniref:Uncharacterized protein n=1 Tax=Gossypium arboreum TaxID=29729 RepID=A0A0B0N3E5_GOSAR|nr:hypothetical protein F383_30896 [Gossypium arboreum]
MYCFQDPKLQ